MSLNSKSFDDELYEARRQEAIRKAQEMIQNAQEGDKQPISDEEFQKLAEENLKNNEYHSLEWWQFVQDNRMYAGREELLAEEIRKWREESHGENMEQVNSLIDKLNEGENGSEPKIDIHISRDRAPIFPNTFKKE